MNVYWHQCWGFKWIFVHMYAGQFCWHQYSPVSLFNCIYLSLCTLVFTCLFVHLYWPVSLYTCTYLYLFTPVFACIFVHLYLPMTFYSFTLTLDLPVSLYTCIYLYLCTPVQQTVLFTSLHYACVSLWLLCELFIPHVEMACHQIIVHHPCPTIVQSAS